MYQAKNPHASRTSEAVPSIPSTERPNESVASRVFQRVDESAQLLACEVVVDGLASARLAAVSVDGYGVATHFDFEELPLFHGFWRRTEDGPTQRGVDFHGFDGFGQSAQVVWQRCGDLFDAAALSDAAASG